ncbi:hypothetical protein OROMI_028004 [Orobanche minor]
MQNQKLPLSYNFHKYMLRSMEDEFYGIVGISVSTFTSGFLLYLLVMLVGTKLQHVVSLLALEIAEPHGPSSVGTQVKPRDDLFWFRKPEILLHLIQFISFQTANVSDSTWGLEQRSCFMKNHAMITVRLVSGVLVQFWCSYSTVPLNVIVTTMGSRFKKALIAESIRDSLHSWCKRVKQRSKTMNSMATRSACSPESTTDEIITIASGTLSPCSSADSLSHLDANGVEDVEDGPGSFRPVEHEFSFGAMQRYPNNVVGVEDGKSEMFFELFRRT